MTHVKFGRRPFERSFNNLVDDLFSELPVLYRNGTDQVFKGFAPVNIKESEKGYSLEVVAPGFEKTDFKVNIDQDVLTVSAEKKEEVKENADNAVKTDKQIRREYSFRSFKRSFTLDEKIDAAGIEAKYNNGVLTLNLPKKEVVKASAQEINIQ
ncbi:MAG: Hsp20/alpha crystallin family protein [Citrobacter freundii]|nr:MAG: Hsp20/alpha crystallin family protein [Citrobacter freundii]